MTVPSHPGRRYDGADALLIQLDQTLATLFGRAPASGRPSPAETIDDTPLDAGARRAAARLMRVNHTGEVCAQALYQGQALTATPALRDTLQQAGREEGDHLRWCRQRIDELGGRPSVLNPLFYAGSLALGAAAGLAGDRWSLGFLVETERQVERHLDGHLDRLPPQDRKSRAVLQQMRADEVQHAERAEADGARPLPGPIRAAMALTSKLMTGSSYRI